MFRYITLLLLPLIVISAATSRGLIRLFFESSYDPAARPLTILMLALGFLALYYLFASLAAGAGRPRFPLIVSWILVPWSIVMGIIFIPRFGLPGAAFATLVSAVIGTIILGIFMRRTFAMSVPFHTLRNASIATALAVAPTYFLEVPFLLLPLEYLLLGAVYVLTLIALGEIRPADLAHVKTLIPKRFST